MDIALRILVLLFVSSLYSQTNSTTEYYRHLRYNHVSPYVDISGIHPIDQATAKLTSHYVFKYDNAGRIVELIKNHYHTEKIHPLASIGVYRLVIEYTEGKEIRIFYDPKGGRISNDRNVYKEVYSYDEHGFKSRLQFYDMDEVPMESNWAIAEYQWKQNGDIVIERRFNSEM